MIAVTTYDNAPPLDGWVPTPKHCGEICTIGQLACRICGEWLPESLDRIDQN